jgi:hypothetical protein
MIEFGCANCCEINGHTEGCKRPAEIRIGDAVHVRETAVTCTMKTANRNFAVSAITIDEAAKYWFEKIRYHEQSGESHTAVDRGNYDPVAAAAEWRKLLDRRKARTGM